MHKIYLALILFLFASLCNAGNWNPFVKEGLVSPTVLLPWQLGGSGIISFTIGNSGSDSIGVITDQELKIVLTLSYGIPDTDTLNDSTAISVIKGSWASFFSWSYNIVTNTFIGTQDSVIPGQSEGTITIDYRVNFNSAEGSPANGFNVNLTPPPFTNGVNLTEDDALSKYTFTRASDFGDAPESYGSAEHSIDIEYLTNAVFLGEKIDYEPVDQPSDQADKDDLTGEDDEDGVNFPVMKRDSTYTLPVVITMTELTEAYISAWIDWDGNGVFSDTGEQVAKDILVTGSGTIDLNEITVPGNAVTAVPTFARIRIGPLNMASTRTYPFGETEDYSVQVINHGLGIGVMQEVNLIIFSHDNEIYIRDPSGRGLEGKMKVYNMVGQCMDIKTLTGGSLNIFRMALDYGYYVVEVINSIGICHGKVFLEN